MCARLSALIFLFTVRSAFQYFFLYLSFGLFELDSTDFLFGGSPVLDGMPGCDPLFLFFCRRPKKDSLVWVYAVLTWSHMVLIPVVSGSTLVSCNYWGTTDSPFMDLQRRILTTEAKQEARWEEHFSEVLNRPPPATKQRSWSRPRSQQTPREKEEIMAAIRSLRNGKAPVQGSLCSELFKADPQFAAEVL